MSLVDSILDVAGLLLWLAGRAAWLARKTTAPPFALVTTLSRPRPSWGRSLFFPCALMALLGLRALLYGHFGPTLDWSGRIDLGAITLRFRSASLPHMLAYSVGGFAWVLGLFYSWMLLLAAVNRSVPDTESWQRDLRRHLGWLSTWPIPLQLLGPYCGAVLAWYAVHPGLVALGITAPPLSSGHLWQQAFTVGAAVFLSWRFLLGGVLFLHVVNSYLYLGNQPFWSFLNLTARHVLRPLRWLPLRTARVDLVPLIALGLVFYLCETAERGLTRLFSHLPL